MRAIKHQFRFLKSYIEVRVNFKAWLRAMAVSNIRLKFPGVRFHEHVTRFPSLHC